MADETPESTKNFKDQNVPLQYLVKELEELRTRNLELAKAGDFFKVQLFAEGAVCMLALEHFLRVILGSRATQDHTLRNLLDMATSKKNGGPLLVLPWDTQPNGCKQLTGFETH